MDAKFEKNENGDIVQHINQPFLMACYEIDITLDEYLIILVPMISGATNVRFEVSDDGNAGLIKYCWPKFMYNITRIFKNENGIENTRILALQKKLSLHRQTHSEIPEGILKFKFPFAVQSSEKAIMGYTDEEHGCKLLRIEIPALKKLYGKTDDIIKFDK